MIKDLSLDDIWHLIDKHACDAKVDPDKIRMAYDSGKITLTLKSNINDFASYYQARQRVALEIETGEDFSKIEQFTKAIVEAERVLSHLHDRFGETIPPWAMSAHPLARDFVEASSYTAEEIIDRSAYEQDGNPDREEYRFETSYNHFNLRWMRLASLLRASGCFATMDVPAVPEATLVAIKNKTVSEIFGPSFKHSADLKPMGMGPTADRTRISFKDNLIPIVDPPAGEDTWWINSWSLYEQARFLK